ncbi:MAG: hypothetical protein NT018_00900 [Armatimonadetes bacterium]|nr:hypothetical protein [Armatimonadota bacterium]
MEKISPVWQDATVRFSREATRGKTIIFRRCFQQQWPYGIDRITETIYSPPEIVRSIYAARRLPENTLIIIPDKLTTAGTTELAGAFYIEELNRSNGLRVLWGG